MVTTKLKVVGMCCDPCVVGVEKALDKITSVRQVDVDMENGVVTVQDEAEGNQEELIKSIKKVRNFDVFLMGESR